MSEETTNSPATRFLIGDDLKPAKELDRTFVGTVVIDQTEQSDRGQRWHLGVKPEGIELQGDTGCFNCWMPWTGEAPGEKSTAGQVITSMREANLRRGDGTGYAPANNELLGVRGLWDRRDLDFGPSRNKADGNGPDGKPKHIIAKGVIFLLEHYADGVEAQEEVDQGPLLTPEEVTFVVGLIDGKQFKDVRKLAMTEVSDEALRTKLLKKTAQEYLEREGFIVVSDDGTYHETPAEETPEA